MTEVMVRPSNEGSVKWRLKLIRLNDGRSEISETQIHSGTEKHEPMKNLIVTSILIVCALVSAVASALQTREQAVGGMRKVEAQEMDATYTKPAPFAQKKRLVTRADAETPPRGSENRCEFVS
jgi:hypothetical protein